MGYAATPSTSAHHDIIIDDPALTEHGFTKFSLPLKGGNRNGTTSVMVVHNIDKSKMMYPKFYKSDIDKTVRSLRDKIVSDRIVIDDDTADGLVAYFRNEGVRLLEDEDSPFFKNGNDNGKSKRKSNTRSNCKQADKEKDQKKSKPTYTAYKYSYNGKVALHESVILAGRPAFIAYENGKLQPYNIIEEDTRVIKPPHPENYPYKPYEFASMDELLRYRDRAVGENKDTLYLKAKQIACDYNDQRKEKISLLAIEIISSYFQDRFPTTHYDIVLGGNGSGKSTYGETFTSVGYRVVNLTDPNAANINRILGCIEVGQCAIVSDETGAIDKQPDLLSLLKTGYSPTGKISKINDFSRAPEYFYTYCFKMIISERMPNLRDARGVVDRSFSFTTYKGLPKYDIKETLEPQGNKVRQQRLDALNDFRKLMLIYRLIHFKDEISDIDVNVQGREKELSKPIIQLFYDTEAQNEVEATLQYFLNLRTEKKEITLEPILHRVVTNLVNRYGTELYVKAIWDELRASISDGYYDEKKPNEYQTLEYGTIYNNSISNILEHTFGGRSKHRESGNLFIFDPEELERVGRAYNLTTKIQTRMINAIEEKCRTRPEGSEGSEGIRESHVDVNHDRTAENSAISQGNQAQKFDEKELNEKDKPSAEPSEGSDPSGQVIEESSTMEPQKVPDSIYRLGHSDLFACKNCKAKGDKWFMMKHLPCCGGVCT
jgi:hypothetical protein